MQLNIIDPNICPHFYKSTCIESTKIVNVNTYVAGNFCGITCKNRGGPYLGKQLTLQEEDVWRKELLHYTSFHSMAKVKERYGVGVSVIVPEFYKEVLKIFSSVLSEKWVRSVGMSGSCLIEGRNPKDVDVVLLVNDYRAFMDYKDQYELPTHILDKKADIFGRSTASGPFMYLDLTTFNLNTSSFYKIDKLDSRINQVIFTQMPT